MRNHSQKINEALEHIPASSIIRILEKGLEVEKLEHLATLDREAKERITDCEMFLTILHFRNIRDLSK